MTNWTETLRQILITVITEFIMPILPTAAASVLNNINLINEHINIFVCNSP